MTWLVGEYTIPLDATARGNIGMIHTNVKMTLFVGLIFKKLSNC